MSTGPEKADAVYEVVLLIPLGTVATYGQVAGNVTQLRVSAREVGGIMAYCPSGVPWHRVVGAGGKLPIAKRSPHLAIEQRKMLQEEGVTFLKNECVNMEVHQWQWVFRTGDNCVANHRTGRAETPDAVQKSRHHLKDGLDCL